MTEFYKKEISALGNSVSLDEVIDLSKSISEEVKEYRHSDWQSAIAAIVLSHNSRFKIVVSPTGSGKTWIQGIIAKYYCSIGKRVVIIEPNK